jgi:hypothetical protein
MSQYDLGLIDPNETSGTELAAMLSAFNEALRSGHKGSTRPGYAERGTTWLQDTGGSVLNWFMFDGVDDLLIGQFNTVSNQFLVSGSTTTLAALGGVPASRQITSTGSILGGGDLTADRNLALKGDSGSPLALHYYGTNSAGVQGWFPLVNAIQIAVPASRRKYILQFPVGTHTFIPPTGVTWFFFQAAGGGGGDAIHNYDVLLDSGGEGSPATYQMMTDVIKGGSGASGEGSVACIPGESYQIVVGNAGAAVGPDYGNVTGGGGQSTTIEARTGAGAKQVVFTGGGGQGGNSLTGPGAAGVFSIVAGENISQFATLTRDSLGRILGSPGVPGYVHIYYFA